MTIKSIAANFLSPSLNLTRLANELDNGELIVKALLVYLVSDCALFFEVGKNMGAEQCRQTADLILEDYAHFKPEDFKLCFSRAKKGHYGPLYDRLDGQIILGWLMKYDNERDGEIESIQAKYNRQLKDESAVPLLPVTAAGLPQFEAAEKDKDELFKKNMAILKQKLDDNKKERIAAREAAKVRPVNKAQEMGNRWLKQFDTLWLKRKVPGRFVRKYGRIMDTNEYLEHKHWQYRLTTAKKDKRMKQYLLKYPKA